MEGQYCIEALVKLNPGKCRENRMNVKSSHDWRILTSARTPDDPIWRETFISGLKKRGNKKSAGKNEGSRYQAYLRVVGGSSSAMRMAQAKPNTFLSGSGDLKVGRDLDKYHELARRHMGLGSWPQAMNTNIVTLKINNPFSESCSPEMKSSKDIQPASQIRKKVLRQDMRAVQSKMVDVGDLQGRIDSPAGALETPRSRGRMS
ncbi:hypothetical protein FB45DRAFT_872973 [Roridomyces roridus]|uniref:Uncharacterized protein n=1 Tax=Roridomyces roridus TaxID=1738132 RepID=A0AAD7FCW7_9AGAR|nr:hypothetical protein FB45DRAFT_872973 [Roridomyces roridus]